MVPIAIRDVRLGVRTLPAGATTDAPRALLQLHLFLAVETADGRRATGVAADTLTPRWFDGGDSRSPAAGLRALVAGARMAAEVAAASASQPRPLYRIWRDAYEASVALGGDRKMSDLVCAHGPTMVERALFDGLGVALGLEYHQLLLDNVAGIDLGDLHPELGGVVPRDLIPVHPLRQLWVRHRVGLVDALYDGESDDPSLESVVRQGIRHFKIQLCGDVERDGARIRRMAPILGRTTELMVSLDGQESFQDLAELVALLDLLESAEEPARRVCEAIRYVEQPLSRQIALDAAVADDVDRVSARKPLLIDASDDTLSAFKRAVGLGYRGVSSKGCKGLMKALANLGLCQHYSARKDGPRPFLSGEDATCLPIVSLHQELAHLAALGIGHAEAGGGHVAQGLSHLPEAERQACQERHGSLYQRLPREEMTLAVRDGRLDLDSVNTAGLGVGLEIDPETTTPLTGWRPEDLEMSTDV